MLGLSQAESFYPSGYSIVSLYEVNSQSLYTNDTLIITRTIVNNESFPVSGLYFSDNFPPHFNLIDYSLANNHNILDHTFDETVNSLFTGYNCFYWIIDDPSGSVQNIINPGDSLVLSLRLVCSLADNYMFPLHTSTFYGNSTSFFSTSDALFIDISTEIDTISPSAINDLEAHKF